MKKVFSVNEVCPSCKGTGLYVGMGERGGAAVVCSKCKGTGCHEFVHEYEEFEAKKSRKNVKRVYRTNPGICIGEDTTVKLQDFGGIPVEDWEAGKSFPPGSEDRQHTCPAWFYQAVGKDKPNWRECAFGRFSDCPEFCRKDECWQRWDLEHP